MARKPNVKPGDTRSAILQAAYESFLENGYHGTSMRDIARRAKLTVAAAYNHFKNKEQLYVAVLHAHQPYNHVLPALADSKVETVEAFVRTTARLVTGALAREPGLIRLVLIEIVEFKSKHIPKLFRDILPQSLAVVRSASKLKGRLRRFPPAVLLRSFLGLVVSYYITEQIIWKNSRPPMQKDCLDAFIDIYLHGVTAPASAE
ncbi:MAG: TetR/AcrR family transcriptional regulator [Anaerolineales bacterium]|nr:TetR/AcrR family transcriptional regulator [Anaerolineales bacterium]